MLKEPGDQRLEKCIRNCQEEEDADAQSDPVWTKQMLERAKKSEAGNMHPGGGRGFDKPRFADERG